jgi:hypothetical protein
MPYALKQKLKEVPYLSFIKITYKIVEKTDNSAFYCSQYLWYLYWKTAKDLDYDLDIDADGGYFVTLYHA